MYNHLWTPKLINHLGGQIFFTYVTLSLMKKRVWTDADLEDQ